MTDVLIHRFRRDHARPHERPTFGFVVYSALLVSFFAAAAAPSPLLVGLQQKWGFSTSLLTVAFAVYALALLATLLVTGSLSDHIGRRPVLVAALGFQVVVAVLFVTARDIWVIVAARVLQGIATGAASGSLTAAVADAASQHHRRLGSIVGGAAPLVGLAAGGLGAGIADRSLADPTAVVFVTLLITFGAGLIVLAGIPDHSPRRPGALQSLVPRLSIPRDPRTVFTGGLPTAIATWSLGGLYLGLGPTILAQVFHRPGGAWAGLAIVALCLTGAVAATALTSLSATKTAYAASAVIAVSAIGVLISVRTNDVGLFFAASVVAGIGFGGGFGSYLRRLAPLATADRRSELYSAMYLVNYLAFGLPALIAGQLAGPLGLNTTVTAYIALIVSSALLGVRAQLTTWHSI